MENIISSSAIVIYQGKIVHVELLSNNGTITNNFEKRKSWSHKKYVDKALEQSNVKPSWDFRYKWEIK